MTESTASGSEDWVGGSGGGNGPGLRSLRLPLTGREGLAWSCRPPGGQADAGHQHREGGMGTGPAGAPSAEGGDTGSYLGLTNPSESPPGDRLGRSCVS